MATGRAKKAQTRGAPPTVMRWDGAGVPAALRSLPAGDYVVQSVADAVLLSPEEEEGIRRALDSLARGKGVPHADVRKRALAKLRR